MADAPHGLDRGLTNYGDRDFASTAASYLADLWRSGRQVTALPPEFRPATLEQGYEIQDRFIADLGERVVGWKLGVGSRKQRAETGIGRSIAGRVLASRCFQPGETIPLSNAAPAAVEFEIAYVLGRDIRPDDPGDGSDAITETRVTFELVKARYVDRRNVGWPSFAADNGAFEALVVGNPVDRARIAEIVASVTVSCDGMEKARAVAGDDITDPDSAFRDFVALARERKMVLPKGAIVSTGTATRPFNIEGPVSVVARYLDREMSFHTTIP
jgi:2-keto-4-pentenoate hydratase